jgi:2-oxo-4-hydroxy-4-carboxy--5-ureidoimidazoline (OHCU) decarboxylase
MPLFEGAPGFLWRLAAARPAGSAERLFGRARELAHASPASVSAMSFREQGYELEARERDPVDTELDRLNREYEGTFGFRYCVFVAGRPRSALLPDMAASLLRERDSELHRALDAVVDIAADRYRSGA